MRIRTLLVFAASVLALPLISRAQTVFTVSTTIADGDATYDGQDITIRGCTVTINGAHAFHSILIEPNASNVAGVLTHAAQFSNATLSGVRLTVTAGVTVAANARIDVSSKGNAAGSGPGAGTLGSSAGGAGYGGAGRNAPVGAGGDCYGAWDTPAELGSGGGNDTNVASTTGGAGGGCVALLVGGVLTVNGSINSDGAAYISNEGGGGSGGSLNIQCATLQGVGTISSRGGNAGLGGSGGGGRIAVRYVTSSFSGQVLAYGGLNTAGSGGAGTVFLKPAASRGALILENTGGASETTEFAGTQTLDADLAVRSGAVLGHKHQSSSLRLTVTGDVVVEAGGRVSVSGRGYAPGTGPGAGNSASNAGGGAHGGAGRDSGATAGGDCYDGVEYPTEFGSGGGNDTNILSATGGAGGGAIAIITQGAMIINGIVSADGDPYFSNEAGGGAGGSILLQCGTLSGSGQILARGGNAGLGGAGGGGRISLAYANSTFSGTTDARGGDSTSGRAGAGTVYFQPSAGLGELVVDNGTIAGEATEFTGLNSFNAALTVRKGGMVSHKHGDATCSLTFAGPVNVEQGGLIAANGRGHPAATGPGAGSGSSNAGGAGHGGAGRDAGVIQGGDCYGSVLSPAEFGSGGGNDSNVGSATGGAGGGLLTISSGGAFTCDGLISADGSPYVSNEAGGGAGGSIFISCVSFAGSGSVTARGGNAGIGGSGGGGRIAVSCGSSSFTGTYDARGGDNAFGRAGAGTVYVKAVGSKGSLLIDNGGVSGEATEFGGDLFLDADLRVRAGGLLSYKPGSVPLDLTISGNAVIESSGAINANGRGSPAGAGAGAGVTASIAGGAGYGGAGRDSASNAAGGNCYGTITNPTGLGSGGGNDSNLGSATGGAGGGDLGLHVAGSLIVDGAISVDGQRYISNEGGGGSGGSLRISCASLSGSGLISARGGLATLGGSGGGGRIAVSYATSTFSGGYDARGGDNTYGRAGAGTIYLKPAADLGTLIIDNFGVQGEGTEWSGLLQLDASVLVHAGGFLTHRQADHAGLTLDVLGDVTIDAGGVIGAVARGELGGQGPGTGGVGTQSGGGGYGGVGRAATTGTPGGGVYGFATYPDALGSGGGNDNNVGGITAGAGGGRVHVLVGGVLTVNGSIDVSGGNHLANEAGGGSGGAIYVLATQMQGSGSVRAVGGNAGSGGSGGGGRIAIYSCSQLIPLSNFSAAGGTNVQGAAQPGSIYFGSSSVNITLQPESTTYSGGDEVSLIVDADGDGPLTYQWRREGQPLADGGRFSGAQTSQLTISPIDCTDGGTYDCIVTDACGAFPTVPAEITVLAPSDYDHSGFVDTDDFSAFVVDFELGIDAADFDKSGFVDTDDFTAFVLAFEAGC